MPNSRAFDNEALRTMSQHEPITASLETAAELAGDITGSVFERYYAKSEPARELMSYVDQYMQGRMLAEVLRLVMADDIAAEREYLDFEIDNHARAYHVEPDMYADLFAALHETVRETLGEAWTERHEQAWHNRCVDLMHEIDARTRGAA